MRGLLAKAVARTERNVPALVDKRAQPSADSVVAFELLDAKRPDLLGFLAQRSFCEGKVGL